MQSITIKRMEEDLFDVIRRDRGETPEPAEREPATIGEKLGRKRPPGGKKTSSETGGKKRDAEPDAESVSALTARIKKSLEADFSEVWVEGELSNVSRPSSGHVYLTLKDDKAEIRGVIWRPVASRLKFDLEDGQKVIVRGSISVYARRGSYQVKINRIHPVGIGDLELAFRQLKEKLEKEGLFDPSRKKELPLYPERIGVVTSPTGAAIRDILNVIKRRYPALTVLVAGVRVQGKGAAEEIAQAIEKFNKRKDVEALIVGRGGGSLEDLWAFNEEVVARAIFKSRIPVISAVGHEVDVSIADLVADHRALTPTEAGEVITPRMQDMLALLTDCRNRSIRAVTESIEYYRQAIDDLARRRVMISPIEIVREWREKALESFRRMKTSLSAALELKMQAVKGAAARLEALSPLKVLGRGFALVRNEGGSVVKDATDISKGDLVEVMLVRGEFTAEVKKVDTKQKKR